MSKIVLTQEERDCLKDVVKHKEIADMAFHKASKMCLDAEKDLWHKIRGMYPDADFFEHPSDGAWTVIVCDKPKESRDTTRGYDNDSIQKNNS